jgi:hypothetical protein
MTPKNDSIIAMMLLQPLRISCYNYSNARAAKAAAPITQELCRAAP